MTQKTHNYIPVTIDYQGKQHRGSYYEERGMITVSSQYGSKTTQIGHSTAELLAATMLRELLDEAKHRGEF